MKKLIILLYINVCFNVFASECEYKQNIEDLKNCVVMANAQDCYNNCPKICPEGGCCQKTKLALPNGKPSPCYLCCCK